ELRAGSHLRSLFLNAADDSLPQALSTTPAGSSFLSKLDAYRKDFGHQVFSFDLLMPTLGEQPEPTFQVLRSYLSQELPDPAEVLAEQARKRQEAVAQVMKAIGSWPEADAETFRALLNWHQICASIREDIAFHFQKLWPLMRAGVLELGRRLERAGALDASDLVFFLTKDELWMAAGEPAGQRSKVGSFTSLARERREAWERQRRLSPPDRIPPPQDSAWAETGRMFGQYGLQRGDDGPVLMGHGASPGRVTAPARVMRSMADFGGLKRGEVLVTVAASPAWTALFALASAVVTEIGGGATHSSMVAREFGIPAVMGTGVATQEIVDGQLITVDGTNGVVYLQGR
ncbi:MAG: PEP-utilizing enzyme, partial [Dehalococcoidia bacterium]